MRNRRRMARGGNRRILYSKAKIINKNQIIYLVLNAIPFKHCSFFFERLLQFSGTFKFPFHSSIQTPNKDPKMTQKIGLTVQHLGIGSHSHAHNIFKFCASSTENKKIQGICVVLYNLVVFANFN